MKTKKINWQDAFSSVILERGKDYYDKSSIREIKKDGEKYTAIVEGMDDYTVQITEQDDSIVKLSCDCPYAQDGSHCKHEAAVLFMLEKPTELIREQLEEQDKLQKQIVNGFKKEMESLDKEELINLLVEIAQSDSDLALKYYPLSKAKAELPKEDLSYSQLKEIKLAKAKDSFKRYIRVNDLNETAIYREENGYDNYYARGYRGNRWYDYDSDYIDTDKTGDRVMETREELEKLAQEIANTILIKEHLEEAFEFSFTLLNEIDELDSYYNEALEDIFVSELQDRWTGWLEEGIPEADLEKLKKVYTAMSEKYSGTAVEFFQDSIEGYLNKP